MVFLRIEAHLLDRIGAAEAHIGFAAILKVLHLDLHIRAAFAGLGMLDFGNLPDAFFILNDIAGTDVDAADFHEINAFEKWRSAVAWLKRALLVKNQCAPIAALACMGKHSGYWTGIIGPP
ncbi:hypothetical protein EH31_00920 [Erythrobacter longus]|uniref:Uncharacterized protein n=1 Tax=Erythrobacter longus TaxID=1044 RepID=A0A074M8Z4_ERYLO|nr:hypothetical protein EH31_00920 [Erythrobacter longus]